MQRRRLVALGSVLALMVVVALPVAFGEEDEGEAEKVRTRNGGYLGLFLREQPPGVVTIERIQPGSGAEKAGLKAGDVVQAVNGRALAHGDQLIRRLWSPRPVTLTVRRDEETVDLRTSARELDAYAQVGDPAPRFRLPLRDGSGEVALDDLLAKGKPVVLVFGSFT